MVGILPFFWIFLLVLPAFSLRHPALRMGMHGVVDNGNAGEAVYVTKYLDKPDLAKKLTRVSFMTKPFTYSGFATTDPSTDTNMFYMFNEAANGDKSAPVILWLQGGPGGASSFGAFCEIGPYKLSDNPPPTHVERRAVSWGNEFATLYIDNPVGTGLLARSTVLSRDSDMTGFSYTTNPAAYSRTEDQVADNLYKSAHVPTGRCLQQFFTVHSEYRNNDFYIAGESYAGKYIPALAAHIDAQNRRGADPPINLKGIAIGDGSIWQDPLTQVTAYADVLRNTGAVGPREEALIRKQQDLCVSLIQARKWSQASDCFFDLIDGPPDLVQNLTYIQNYYDLRKTVEPDYGPDFAAFLNRTDIRAQLNVGNHYFQGDPTPVIDALHDDISMSVIDKYPLLLERGYKGNLTSLSPPPRPKR